MNETKTRRWNLYVRGWNVFNNPSSDGGWESRFVGIVEAETEEEACRLFSGKIYNNQHVWAEDADESEQQLAELQERIDSFFEPREGKRLYISQNGGPANPNWLGEYNFDDSGFEVPVAELQEVWNFCESGREAEVATAPGWATSYEWRDDPWRGVRAVACCGVHYGFEWGASCEDIDTYVLCDELKTDDLEDLISAGYAEQIGLEAFDDPTDDGNNFHVKDEGRFLKAARLCAEFEYDDWDLLVAELDTGEGLTKHA